MSRNFETIKKEIKLINHKIANLTEQANNLQLELQKACEHPKKARRSTGAGEKCGKCKKILQFYIPRIGNLF